jgi:hypothetical protein
MIASRIVFFQRSEAIYLPGSVCRRRVDSVVKVFFTAQQHCPGNQLATWFATIASS